ncbi:tripartite tricarboxylate transporter TctB family protein [Mangrovicoccus sp. HB161399]|uniref:tripartite tricarboxylate transporter TctB family protein n=1 Tax=Mangrovicoccus sp. HB161399 TaxID=2720392 RepID=UPI001552728C|nr:tripartite tricarboxylate transporter TctB family protein [Mangrovicoccus sp. HB161399]
MQPPIDGSTRKTLAAAAFFLALCAAGLAMLRHSRLAWQGMSMPGDPGPFFLIRLCLWAVGLAGAALLVLGLLTRRPAPRKPTGELLAAGRSWLLSALLAVSLVAMPALMDMLGTAPAVAIFATAWIALLIGLRDGWGPRLALPALGFGIGAAVFVHLVFIRLLSLPLPT